MSGVAVIRYLLANNAPLLAALGAGPPVASARVVAGDLPINTVMPAIAVQQVSSVPLNFIKTNETPKLHTDRVQVSVLVKGPQATPPGTGYPGVRSLLRLVLLACPSQRGIVNTFSVDSITPEAEGPDLQDDATGLFSCSRDFIVRWWAP